MFSEYTKKRILFYNSKGHCAPRIAKLLAEEGITVSRQGVNAFLVRVRQTGTIARRPGDGRPIKQWHLMVEPHSCNGGSEAVGRNFHLGSLEHLKAPGGVGFTGWMGVLNVGLCVAGG